LTAARRRDRRRRPRQPGVVRWALAALAALLIFAFGVALGEALHDNPKPGSTVTLERTLTIPTTGKPGSTVIP
jgi:hypothetical protein